ncbi:hypothetical protein [Vibrio phage J14]|nr:hypothetical protein [Vibrio phage J14]
MVRFHASGGANLFISSSLSRSRLPDDLKVIAPAKVNVKIIKVFRVAAVYGPEWRDITLAMEGANPFTLTADQMFHSEPMTFLTFDAYLRRLNKPLKPQLSAEFEVYVNDPIFYYADSINTMRLKSGVAEDHRLNGYDVLTLIC